MKPSLMKPDHLRLFPCCVCGEAREVGTTKKNKPYLICDPCGVQVFVEEKTGFGDLNSSLPMLLKTTFGSVWQSCSSAIS